MPCWREPKHMIHSCWLHWLSLSLTDIAALHIHAALLKGALVHGLTTSDSTGSLSHSIIIIRDPMLMDSSPVTPLVLSPLPILQPCTSTPPSAAKGSPSTWIYHWWLRWPSLSLSLSHLLAALHVHTALLKEPKCMDSSSVTPLALSLIH